ncbi:hypothetical protein PS893_01100 [Pseudomonas fluorescens]|jgi:hypothetical protein|uniref:Uncharacterized protein n=2 Tax=Pseudomonas TaxID=286 RepID=A0A1H4V2Y0_PSEJE|nr:hypothetical protein SAMN04490187_5584 [Pseudomonas jessenii]VVM88647.1 hypothetical protein PS673_02663 [Pseudomonas fluorescens]VVO67436.1 hypothetical protein PS893_01100 [Pseudomonas fluorescens]
MAMLPLIVQHLRTAQTPRPGTGRKEGKAQLYF